MMGICPWLPSFVKLIMLLLYILFACWNKYTTTKPGYFLRQKCRPKNVVFNDVSFMAVLAGDLPSDSVKVRHFPLASENLTNNQP